MVCPSFVYLDQCEPLPRERASGSAPRICRQQASGAFTGEMSGAMLRDAGCNYVLVGHSERRSLLGDSDEWSRPSSGRARKPA